MQKPVGILMQHIIRAVLILISMIFITSCSEDKAKGEIADITLAAEMSLLPATVWVAENLGLFAKHNINLTIKEFDSGRNALETMLKDNSIDIATVAQTPIVFNSFNSEPYVIVATMAYSLDDIKVLARKDRGINQAEDLRGKRIGATKRSTGHYFLESYLSHYGMSIKEVELHDINASMLRTALESGEVDAITSWEPHIHNTEESMGKSALSLLISPTPFRKDFFFTTSRDYAVKKKRQVQNFLSALIEAEMFIQKNPNESQQIISQRLGVDMALIERIWSSFSFEITLEQSILVNLEDEALWAINLSDEKMEAPNYLDFIDINPLFEIKPHGVNLIH